MARQQKITYVDDIDKIDLAADEVRVIDFAYRGSDYSIDLSELNAAIFEEEMEPFLAAARKKPRRAGGAAASATSSSSSSAVASQVKERNRRIRAWALDNDLQVSSRGRISADVIRDYEAANPQDR